MFEIKVKDHTAKEVINPEDTPLILKISNYCKHVRSIGEGLFSGNKNIRTVIIPKDVIDIEKGAFSGCENLEHVFIETGSKLRYIRESAFENCHNLRDFEFEKCTELISIEAKAFANNILLERLLLSNTKLLCIQNNAFINSIALKELSFPPEIQYIGKEAFKYSRLSKLDLSPLNNELVCLDSESFAFSNLSCIISSSKANVYLQDGVFKHCEMESLDCENFVFQGSGVFFSCEKLKEVTIKNCKRKKLKFDYTILPKETFRNCHELEKVDIQYPFKTIDSYAFSECVLLKDVKLPRSLTQIERFAFNECILLRNVDLTECNIENMAEYCFSKTNINNNDFKLDFCSGAIINIYAFISSDNFYLSDFLAEHPFCTTSDNTCHIA